MFAQMLRKSRKVPALSRYSGEGTGLAPRVSSAGSSLLEEHARQSGAWTGIFRCAEHSGILGGECIGMRHRDGGSGGWAT